MNTLSIPQIFSQLTYYQENYLQIIADPAQYYIPVTDAHIKLWPLAQQSLYLGDLLQLWFAEKWLVETERQFSFEEFLNADYLKEQSRELYIYAISGNLLTGTNQSKAWQASTAQIQDVELANVSKHYFEFQGLSRPQIACVQAGQTKGNIA
ncbi:hypothetical protein LDO52_04785 [Acinetobacter pseudolwoffii]|uniref:hypothetical protein n=1 Tax=Acinetobacter pseudolwoffii TaxID=2053287 RepID=UPI001CE190B7|nr:hypothetical protein [Acinetobacter pseudolwoffii]UBX53271.1 hypothetical protein LDO52_04785 [Acinetobacter pseudolwoffii]